MLDVRPPLDAEALRLALAKERHVQFQDPLSPSEYEELARLLDEHPAVTLRAYGTDPTLASLHFLEHFPRLRRLSIAHLYNVATLEPLNILPADVEFLDIGETLTQLDLGRLRFEQLRRLRVAGHHLGLVKLLSQNPRIENLALWRIRHGRAVSQVNLPWLSQLEMVLGSVDELEWLTRFPLLQHLAMGQVRGVDDQNLSVVGSLQQLKWLRLTLLPRVTRFPDLDPYSGLVRVDLEGMNGMRGVDALVSLASAPNLMELEVTSSRLPLEAFRPLAGHAALVAATVGLGSFRKNDEVRRMLGVPQARPVWEFADQYFKD